MDFFLIRKWEDMRNDIIFTTICISDPALDEYRGHFRGKYYYVETANILINSILKNTRHSIIVVTDVPEKFTSSERVIIRNIKEFTDEPRLVQRYMNFHLKRYAIKTGFDSPHEYVVYLDCDLFIEKFNEEIFTWMDSRNMDVAGKLGITDIRAMLDTPACKQKITQFGHLWSDEFLSATLPFEMFLVFKKNEQKQRLFIDFWDKVAVESLKYKIDTLYDSYYIGTAIYYARMNKLNLQQSTDLELLDITQSFFNGLRVIHSGHVCTFDIVQLEQFNYKTLLDKLYHAI